MEVDIADEYAYVVVQFLQLPYADIGDYTCVPHSWIRTRRGKDRKVKVAYPDESPLTTKIRIMNTDKPSQRWKLYMAIIKHETYSYEDAYEFIREKLHNASTNRYSTVMSTDYNLEPDTATKRYSRILKRTNLLDPQSKKNKNKLELRRVGDTISNSSKPSKHSNVESTSLIPSELLGHVTPESIIMKETDGREYQEEISRNVQPRYDDLLHRYPHLQRIPKTGNGTQPNSPGASSQSTTGKTLYASRNPLVFINQIINDSQQPQEHQLSSIYDDHLHDITLTHGIQNKGIPNLQTYLLDISKPLTRNPNIESNTFSIIQDPKNKAFNFSQLDISKSSPVNINHPQVSSIQKTPGQSTEVECTISKPSSSSEMANASYASVGGSNLAEHQDPSIEKIVVDESSEVSCVEQSFLSERRAENESSVVRNSLEKANYSDQSAVRSMGGLPMNDEVTLNDVLSTQDVDNDERSNAPEISSEEILTVSPNSNERVCQAVDSLFNKADTVVDRMFDLFQRMEIESSQTCQLAHDLHKSLVHSHGVIECIANASKNIRESMKVIGGKAKQSVEVQQMSEQSKAERVEEENPDVNMKENMKNDNDEHSKISINDENNDDDNRDTDDTDEDGDDEVVKTTRGNIRTFVLPPEYDPDDTRWTLKYREHDPELNLVELVPHSNVFINSIKLAHCKRVSKDSKALARMLLVEVFSQTALSVCSLTGVRANAFDISGTNVRPGLDEVARMAILSFVEKHAKKKKWGAFDSQSVVNSLRSKIQDVRAKHGTTA